MIVLFI